MFSGFDYRFGGGRPRLLVAHVLDTEVLPTLGQVTPGLPLASEYLSEVGALLRLAAWTAHDVGYHWLAQSYFTQALRLAKAAGNRTLGGRIFAGMSHQANFLGYYHDREPVGSMTSPDLRVEERVETVEDALPEEEDRAGLAVPASTFAGSGSVVDVVRLGDAISGVPFGL